MLVCLDQRTGTGCGIENPNQAQFCRYCGKSLRFALQLHDPGAVIGAYRIIQVMGHGSFGAVYAAEVLQTQGKLRAGAQVAIKETFDTNSIGSFRSEFATLQNVYHPNLPRYYDLFEDQGNGYLIMELVPGENLAELLKRNGGPLAEAVIVGYALQLCDVVGYLHKQNPPILHRDIKPANIRLMPNGQIKLVDFGLLKQGTGLTRSTIRGIGTPEYAPVEQFGFGGQSTDPRSDIYSMGATLYHLLTGQLPPLATARVSIVPDPLQPPRTINPAVSPHVSDAVVDALGIKQQDRLPTAALLALALQGRVSPPIHAQVTRLVTPLHPPLLAPTTPVISPQPLPTRQPARKQAYWSLIFIVVLLVMLGSGGMLAMLFGWVPGFVTPTASLTTGALPPTLIAVTADTPTPTKMSLIARIPPATPTVVPPANTQAPANALPTDTPTPSPSPTQPVDTPTPTATSTSTPIPEQVMSLPPTAVPKPPTPTDTPTPTVVPRVPQSLPPTKTPTPTDTPVPPTPTDTPAPPTPTPTLTPLPPTPTDTPVPPTPTDTPLPPTPTPTPTFTPVPTPTPTFTPVPTPTDTPAPPTPTPTQTPIRGNIAPRANRSPDGIGSNNAFDGNLSTFWMDGLGHTFTLRLSWSNPIVVNRILIWDRPQNSPDNNQINALIITLSNGWSKRFNMQSGGPRCIDVTLNSPQSITSVTLKADDASGNNGLSEVEIWAGSKTTGPSCSNKGSMP